MLTLNQVEFRVNDVRQSYAMKLGDGGEAFFVFETSDDIPEGLQTSPLVSPAASPETLSSKNAVPTTSLQEPEYLDLGADPLNRVADLSLTPKVSVRTFSDVRSDLGKL